jgi:hypothetical protein
MAATGDANDEAAGSSTVSASQNDASSCKTSSTNSMIPVNPLSEFNNNCNQQQRPPRLPFIGRIDSFWRETSKTVTTAAAANTTTSSSPANLLSPGSTASSSTTSSSTPSSTLSSAATSNSSVQQQQQPAASSEKGEYNLRKGSPNKKHQVNKSAAKASESAASPSPPVIIEEEEKMMVKVRWFYHPSEAVSKHKRSDPMRLLVSPEGGLFESFTHSDENDVQTIACKCHVLTYQEFVSRKSDDANRDPADRRVYYLAGKYEPLAKEITFEPDVPLNTSTS